MTSYQGLAAPAATVCVNSLDALEVTGNSTACTREATEHLLTSNAVEVAMVAVAALLDNSRLGIDG